MTEQKQYTKITKAEDGKSRFEDCEIALTERPVVENLTMSVAAIPSSLGVTYLRSDAFDSEPHPAPQRQWVVMLRGVIEVTVSDGSKRQFGAGDLVLVEDTEGEGHVTTAVGSPPFEGLFIAAVSD